MGEANKYMGTCDRAKPKPSISRALLTFETLSLPLYLLPSISDFLSLCLRAFATLLLFPLPSTPLRPSTIMEASRGPPRVKNKAPAPVQISAEQLLREAVDRSESGGLQAPTTRFSDLEELHEYQGRKRREFEDYVRRNRLNMNNWFRYAQFELEQREYRRARSIFERALDVDPTDVRLWLRYIDAETRHRNIQHSRNLFDRAVKILPRADRLWYRWIFQEEMLGNVGGTREIFERWMAWEPDEAAWSAYIKFEKRYGEIERASELFKRLTSIRPDPRNWLKWAKFEEEESGDPDDVRDVFGAAIETMGEEFMDEKIYVSYARYETRQKEVDRARAIYKYALDRLPRSKANKLYKSYTTFEKQFGDREGVEDVILSKRRVQYEEQVRASPKNYDAWLDFARLEETGGDPDKVRDVYERAIAQVPPSQEKRHWRRYIFIWLFMAMYEEIETKDIARARQVYDECLRLIPHKKFTFAKVWVSKARFLIRQGDLSAARKTMGQAIGMCPKDKLFRSYVEMELKLFEFVRCRKLYEQQIAYNPSNSSAFIKYAELERGLDDADRARGIFEIAVQQASMDMPELVWKAYIDFEEEESSEDGDFARVRGLYERLLSKTDHVKVWTSYAQFELNVPDPDAPEPENEDEEQPPAPASIDRARGIFDRAYKRLKSLNQKEERVALLQAWKAFEAANGSKEDQERVAEMMPRRVKKRRKLDDESFEEYLDWIFPKDDEGVPKLGRLMEMAQKWKTEQANGTS